MTRILVYEPLSAGAPETDGAPGRDSPEHREMLAAGQAMRDAIARDLARLPGITVTLAVDLQETGHAAEDRGILKVHPLPGETAVDFVHRQSRLHDLCWVVAPESGGLLYRLQQAVGDERWIGCSGPAIRLAGSKHATCTALAAAGIATPLAFAGRHRGAWIVKPDDGAGALDTRRHHGRVAAEADLQDRRRAGQHAIVEPFVTGEPLSVSLVVGPDLARPVAFNRQRLQMDSAGFLHDLGVQAGALAAADPRATPLHVLARQVAAALPGLRGYVGVDVVWNEREGPVVIEVNPRVTCAYVGLSAMLHRNLAADILAVHRWTGVHEVAGHVTP